MSSYLDSMDLYQATILRKNLLLLDSLLIASLLCYYNIQIKQAIDYLEPTISPPSLKKPGLYSGAL